MGIKQIKKKTPQLRQYALTYPRCNISKQDALRQLKMLPDVTSIVVSTEMHHQEHVSADSSTNAQPESSSDQPPATHLHCFVKFATRLRRKSKFFELTAADGSKRHGNIESCTNVMKWIQYLTKEDKNPATMNFDVKECLGKKSPSKTVSRMSKLSITELGEEVHPKDLQRTLAGIKLYQALTRKVEDLKGPCGIWIRGDAGIGKSYETRRYCTENNLSFYLKPRNKWWDTYGGEDVVIIDDIAECDKQWLTPYLKIWADAYTFDAETKGGTIKIRPKWIIVTANYNVEDFVLRMEDFQPMKRRFVESDWLTEREQTTGFLKETIWDHQPEVPLVPEDQ